MACLYGAGRPLTHSSVYQALLRFPFALFLTTPRILWQAAKLHYSRRLDVYPRPEPFVQQTENIEQTINKVEAEAKAGNLLWQPMSSTDEWLKSRLMECMEPQALIKDVFVTLRSANTDVPTTTIGRLDAKNQLSVYYLSPAIFTDLLLARTPASALLVGSKVEKLWSTSDANLFCHLLVVPTASSMSLAERICRSLRSNHDRWKRSFCSESLSAVDQEEAPRHPFDHNAGLKLVWVMLSVVFAERLAYWLFRLTNARFVKGSAPWEVYSRKASYLQSIRS